MTDKTPEVPYRSAKLVTRWMAILAVLAIAVAMVNRWIVDNELAIQPPSWREVPQSDSHRTLVARITLPKGCEAVHEFHLARRAHGRSVSKGPYGGPFQIPCKSQETIRSELTLATDPTGVFHLSLKFRTPEQKYDEWLEVKVDEDLEYDLPFNLRVFLTWRKGPAM